jgi:GNAT superfamily N-acetyltransferase
MSIRIVPFEGVHVSDAARMFVASLDRLRRGVPALPADLADIDAVCRRLEPMGGFAAMDGARLAGYLTSWFPIERFRGTDRVGAYSPEWAHGSSGADQRAIDNALYRAASAVWSTAGCDTHAITLLAVDDLELQRWFWSGFGMGTVDAIRGMDPLGAAAPSTFIVRSATAADALSLAALDVEHTRHYHDPPVFMAPRVPDDPDAWSAFLGRAGATAWLAEDDDGPFGFMRFGREFDASAVVESASGIFISGAYVQPRGRRKGAATALLDAALRHYAATGTTSCAVDFEAFNPEAAAFWPRHFSTVCTSLMRVPEWPVT